MRLSIFPVEVGKEIIAQPTGNIARYYYKDTPFITGKITKIARKYFYVQMSNHREVKFEIETFESKCEDCNSGFILYDTLEDYLNERERIRMLGALRELLSYTNTNGDLLTAEKIKAMYNIAFGEIMKETREETVKRRTDGTEID